MAAMESWGTELWDKYSELTAHAHNGIDFLENYVARLGSIHPVKNSAESNLTPKNRDSFWLFVERFC